MFSTFHRALILFCGILLQSSCATMSWPTTEAGQHTLAETFGVGSVYEVDSTIQILDTNFSTEASEVHGDMKGRIGLGVQAEYFPVNDYALFYGVEYRAFEPTINNDLFDFGQASQTELYLGNRYYLPWGFHGLGSSFRPFLQAKFAYIPAVRFNMVTRIPLGATGEAVLESPFRGSPYWTFAAGTGLAYLVSEDLSISLGVFYELPLSKSSGISDARLIKGSGNDFIDNILDQLQFEVELEPFGWIGFLNINYTF